MKSRKQPHPFFVPPPPSPRQRVRGLISRRIELRQWDAAVATIDAVAERLAAGEANAWLTIVVSNIIRAGDGRGAKQVRARLGASGRSDREPTVRLLCLELEAVERTQGVSK